jgi:uncharacterized membrane protein
LPLPAVSVQLWLQFYRPLRAKSRTIERRSRWRDGAEMSVYRDGQHVFIVEAERFVRRLKFLDGLRGWGAVFVLLYHVCSEGLPIDPVFGDRLKYFIPFSGTLAVLIFFVVSGFSLSVRYLSDGDIRSWSKIAAGRYLRLFRSSAVLSILFRPSAIC